MGGLRTFQEVSNAVSMMIPSAVLLINYFNFSETCNIYTRTLLQGTLLHLPFSMLYHILCAIDHFEDRINCWARKLDQTFIHINGCFICYSLSGNWLYTTGVTASCVLFISRLWQKDTSAERRFNLALLFFMYTFPILYRGDRIDYALALGCWTIAALFFFLSSQLHGWGHTLFHVMLGAYAHVLFSSAAKVPCYIDSLNARRAYQETFTA